MINGKTYDEIWFDNWMAKPPLVDNSSHFSVSVFFHVSTKIEDEDGNVTSMKNCDSVLDGYYCGQFDYDKREWTPVPKFVGCNSFKDRYIKRWMHIPDGAAYDKMSPENS